MRRTIKYNKNNRKTMRKKGGGKNENNKMKHLALSKLDPLPPSPGSKSNNLITENVSLKFNYNSNNTRRMKNRGITINPNAPKIVPLTFNDYLRKKKQKLVSNVTKKLTFWEKLRGKESANEVLLNAYGYPIKSAFNINKNRGYKPGSK
jgi:hypothetical protein